MTNQQATLKEYTVQAGIAKIISRHASTTTIQDMEAMNEAAYDDYGFPISGDHLARRK